MTCVWLARWMVLATALSLLTACGGYATIKQTKKDETYIKTIDSLLVVVDLSHLNKALAEARTVATANPALLRQVTLDVEQAFKEKLLQELRDHGVQVAVETVNLAVNPQAIRMATLRHPQRQVLLANVSSFMTSTTVHTYRYQPMGSNYNGWTGVTLWKMALYDRDRIADQSPASVWSAEIESNLGPSRCATDKYLTCAARFASGIVQQLRTDRLLKS